MVDISDDTFDVPRERLEGRKFGATNQTNLFVSHYFPPKSSGNINRKVREMTVSPVDMAEKSGALLVDANAIDVRALLQG